METERDDGRQQREQDEHQQYLLANPMSQAEYDKRKELWDSFFPKEKGNQATHAMPVSKE